MQLIKIMEILDYLLDRLLTTSGLILTIAAIVLGVIFLFYRYYHTAASLDLNSASAVHHGTCIPVDMKIYFWADLILALSIYHAWHESNGYWLFYLHHHQMLLEC